MTGSLVRSTTPQTWRNKADAALRRDTIRLLQQLKEDSSEARPTWEHFLDAALGDTARSPHTRRSYQQGGWAFIQWAVSGDGSVNLLRPSRRDGQRYLDWLRDQAPDGKPYRPATLQSRLAAARAVMTALHWAGVGGELDLFKGVRVRADPTPSIVLRPPYGDDALTALKTLRDDPEPDARRLWVLALLCLHAGLRVAEALSLTPAHVEGGRTLRLTGKGGKTRRVPLSQQLTTELSLLSAPEGQYFTWDYHQVHYRMTQVFAASGLRWRGFHGLRKTCATRLYEATGDFTRVGLFLGHASADTTRQYVEVRADDLGRYVDGWNTETD